MNWPAYLPCLVALVVLAIPGLAACMLSSELSQLEEQDELQATGQ